MEKFMGPTVLPGELEQTEGGVEVYLGLEESVWPSDFKADTGTGDLCPFQNFPIER